VGDSLMAIHRAAKRAGLSPEDMARLSFGLLPLIEVGLKEVDVDLARLQRDLDDLEKRIDALAARAVRADTAGGLSS
jgi:hypothetical protein